MQAADFVEDAMGKLLAADEQDWSLDPTGNWSGFVTKAAGATTLDQSRTSNRVNQITGISETAGTSWVDPAYDPAGNMTTLPQPPAPDQAFEATYDAWNRLTTLSTGGDLAQGFAYDGRHRRIIKDFYTSGVLGATSWFYFTDDWRAIEQRVGNTPTLINTHVWGIRYIDELVCRDDGQRHYACQDGNFNTTAVVRSDGSVRGRYLYDPYGTPTLVDGSWGAGGATSMEFLFCGYWYDHAPAGLYCVRFRHLHPGLGVWTQRDMAGYVDGANLAEYVGDDPIGRLDSYGLNAILGAFSGIEIGQNYVRTWLLRERFAVNPSVSAYSKLGFSDVLFKSRETLNHEASSIAKQQFTTGQFCGTGQNRTQVNVLMLAPKTHTELKIANRCCDINVTVVFNPFDIVPNQSIFASDNIEFWQKWGTVIPVDIDVFGGHGPAGIAFTGASPEILRRTFVTRDFGKPAARRVETRWERVGRFNPVDWVRKHTGPGSSGYTFVCHSQGCNILMKSLRVACSK